MYFDYTSSYDELLVKDKLSSLQVQRTRLMAIETFKIINGIAPPVLDNILQKETVDITLDTQIFYSYHKFAPQVMVRTHSAMPLQFFGIPYLNILELVTILINLSN